MKNFENFNEENKKLYQYIGKMYVFYPFNADYIKITYIKDKPVIKKSKQDILVSLPFRNWLHDKKSKTIIVDNGYNSLVKEISFFEHLRILTAKEFYDFDPKTVLNIYSSVLNRLKNEQLVVSDLIDLKNYFEEIPNIKQLCLADDFNL